MKRFRLSTLMLLIVIAALGTALVVQQRRAARREAELQARLAQAQPLFSKLQEDAIMKRLWSGDNRSSKQGGSGGGGEGE